MDRIIVRSKLNSDGVLHLDLPVGKADADRDVQVTVEPIEALETLPGITAADLLRSGLVGMWADRTDIGDSREYARRLREQAQTRRQGT